MNNIFALLSSVMGDVGAVRKNEKNAAQGFNFRGIDSVVNAVSPALRKHGVIVFPSLVSCEQSTVEVGARNTKMGHVRVVVTYTFAAPDGSTVAATVAAESMDSGDKATAKAMSVAFRTALLQTLCLPTDEIDPDHEVFERSAQSKPSRLADLPAQPVRKPVEASNGGGVTKTQVVWILKQVANRGDSDAMPVLSRILGRTVASFDDLSGADARVVLAALSEPVTE